MDLQTFFENFDTIAEAPGGIDKLRSLILDLAVRGKLTRQKKTDEPASVLLERIDQEFQELIKSKKLRKIKSLPKVDTSEIDTDVPRGWELCRLGTLIRVSSGKNLPSKNMAKHGEIPVYGGNGVTGHHDEANICQTTLVIGRVGFYCGSIHITPKLAWITDNAFITFFSGDNLDLNFLYWLLKATDLQKNNNATAQPVISGGKIYPIPVLLPPLKEQKRIVATVDELMALCDRLQEAQEKRDRDRQKLRASALDALMNAPTDDALDQAWAFVRDRWDDLNQQPDDVKEMRSLLSNFAIRGKLPTRNVSDEPSLKLLDRINENRMTLVKEKKISKPKKLTPLTDDLFPYELPASWTWIRLGQVIKKIEYGTSSKASLNEDDIPVFRMGNIQGGEILFENLKYVPDSIKDLPKLFLADGDILFNRTNSFELVGKSGVFRGPSHQYTFASYLIRLTFLMEYSNPDYFNIVLNSGFFRRTQIEPEITQQCGQANFNGTKLQHTLIPMPPIEEQHRIVEQVRTFKGYCDRLENSLRQSQEKASALASAAIANLEV